MWTSPAAANGSGFGYQTFPSGVHERRQPRAVWPVGRRAAVREQPPQRRRAADARGGPKQRRLQMRRRRANSLPQKVGLGAWGASALGFEHRANCHCQTDRAVSNRRKLEIDGGAGDALIGASGVLVRYAHARSHEPLCTEPAPRMPSLASRPAPREGRRGGGTAAAASCLSPCPQRPCNPVTPLTAPGSLARACVLGSLADGTADWSRDLTRSCQTGPQP